MNTIKYTSIDTVLSKFYRDLKDPSIDETDIIEWIGEALELMNVAETTEECLFFAEVKDHETPIPFGLSSVLQIARNNSFQGDSAEPITDALENLTTTSGLILKSTNIAENPCSTNPEYLEGYPIPLDRNGLPIVDFDVAYFRPYVDLQYNYSTWVGSSVHQNYTPVRLADNTFFNSVVSKESDQSLYDDSTDEYTIVGTTQRLLRFSFETGFVAISYLKLPVDDKTGYPLIPDNVSYLTAINYYIRWKISEFRLWRARAGSLQQVEYNETRWLKYCIQGKSYMKMPKSLDTYQNLLEQSHKLIPNHKKYYNFFGTVNKAEDTSFKNPDNRIRH